jgi:DNA anti-recombination protein RmuC
MQPTRSVVKPKRQRSVVVKPKTQRSVVVKPKTQRSVSKRTTKSVKKVNIVEDCKGVCDLQEIQLRNLTEETIRSLKEDHSNRVRNLQDEMNKLRSLGDSDKIKKELSAIQQELKTERENVSRQLKEAVENANRIHSENLEKMKSSYESELSRWKTSNDTQIQYCEKSKKEIGDKLSSSVNELHLWRFKTPILKLNLIKYSILL